MNPASSRRSRRPLRRLVSVSVVSVLTLSLLLIATVWLYGNSHKHHSSKEEFTAAAGRVFHLYGADPISHFVTLPKSNLRTHYLEQGEGPPLLAIHGGNSMSASWAPLARALSQSSRLKPLPYTRNV